MGRRSEGTDSVTSGKCLYSNEVCDLELKLLNMLIKFHGKRIFACYVSTLAIRREASGDLAKGARNLWRGIQPQRGR